MRYKIILSNTNEAITIKEEELTKVLNGINQGSVVIVSEGIFNPSYFVAVVVDHERNQQIAEAKRMNYKFEEPSPFAKLLAPKMKMLSDQDRTKALEEVAKQERKIKK